MVQGPTIIDKERRSIWCYCSFRRPEQIITRQARNLFLI